MGSGNYLIGNGLSMEGFTQYILPMFAERGFVVPDRFATGADSTNRAVLISMVGQGNLERGVSEILVASGVMLDDLQKKLSQRGEPLLAWKHQVSGFSHVEGQGEQQVSVFEGIYEVIGTYQADDAASQLFPSIAQGYILNVLKSRADDLVDKIHGLLDTKLSDL
ncbi:MAG: hypothetical protein ABIH41_04060 [Nanoarchaeota archaeon]